MNRKEQFLEAVRILAPGDAFALRAASGIPENRLPAFPGGVALEFVSAIERLKGLGRCTVDAARPRRCGGAAVPRPTCRSRATLGQYETAGVVENLTGNLKLHDALRVKAAEYWLKLGEPAQAILELQGLPGDLQKHTWVVRVSLAALRAIRESREILVQE
jgi:hypothetical protein